MKVELSQIPERAAACGVKQAAGFLLVETA